MQFRLQYAIYALNTSSSSSRLSNKISSFDLLSFRITTGFHDFGNNYFIGDKNCLSPTSKNWLSTSDRMMIILKRSCSSVMALT